MEKLSKKILVVIFIGLFALAIVFTIYYFYKDFSLKRVSIGTPPLKKDVKLEGVVKMGFDVPSRKSYCQSEAYLITSDNITQLRVPDNSKLAPEVYFEKYLGSKVEVGGITTDLVGVCTETAKDCSCDSFILVDDIKILDSFDFIQTGFIACLPSSDEGCTYGFKNENNEYFLLNGLTKDALKNYPIGSKVEIKGTKNNNEIKLGEIKLI